MQIHKNIAVAILDDVPDCRGTVWSADAVKFPAYVPLTIGFDKATEPIGTAWLYRHGATLNATFEIFDDAKDGLDLLTPSVVGMAHKFTRRADNTVLLEDLTLNQVVLCDQPNSDPRIISLGKQLLRQTIKVFAMNDCDWYAGATAEDATRGMAENLGFETTPEAIAEMCEEYTVKPVELSDEDLERKMFADDDEDGAKGSVERSFRAQLDNMIATGEEFPCFFASTEF